MTPERQALAAAIQRYKTCVADIERARTIGLRNAQDKAGDARQALDAARAALRQAEDPNNASRGALQRALGDEHATPSIDALRRNVEAAQVKFDDAVKERELVEQEIRRIEAGELAVARANRDAAIHAVIAAEGGPVRLVEEFGALLARANAIREALQVLILAVPPEYRHKHQWGNSGLEWRDWQPYGQPDESIAAPYRVALAALATDPTAPLPGGTPPSPVKAAA